MFRKKYPYWRSFRDRGMLDDFFNDLWPYDTIGEKLSVFDEFEEQFRRMQQRMNDLYLDTIRGKQVSTANGDLRVYGWTYKVGSDGKPVFQEFGNMPKTSIPKENELPGSREPLIDIQESDKEIDVIAEIPGVSKKDIDLEVTEDSMIIKVDSPNRRYYKEIQLPAEVDSSSGNAKFTNGVLSITLKKLKPRKKGKKIKVD